MILRCIEKVQRSTKKGSASMLPVGIMFILAMVVFTNYIYRRQMLQYNYSNIENCLIDSLLAGAVVNVNELARNGNIVIDDTISAGYTETCFDRSYNIFKNALKNNLGLNDAWEFAEYRDFEGALNVDEYIVYNYYKLEAGFQVVEISTNGTLKQTLVHPVNEKVYVDANGTTKEITETSVYAKITFNQHLMNRISWMESLSDDMMTGTYSLRRLIAVTDR